MTNGEKYKGAKERAEAFWKWYRGYIHEAVESFANWLDLEAESEEPLPCPFCGKKNIYSFSGTEMDGYQWHCACHCGYHTPDYDTKDAAIAAHNRVARAANTKGNDK